MSGSHHHIEPEVHNGVSTLDCPSAKWGWHHVGVMPIQIFGWFSVFVLLAYNFGNHRGHVETIYLFLFAIVISLGLVLQLFTPRFTQVRGKLTSHNKPEGHVEPNWTEDQRNLTGVYAALTDSQLRSWNIEPNSVKGAHAKEPGSNA